MLLTVMTLANSMAGVSFEAGGQVRIHYREDLNIPDRSFQFSVCVDEYTWLIRTQPDRFLLAPSQAAVEYYESSSDGTNLYYVSVFNPSYDRAMGQQEALRVLKDAEQQLLKSRENSEHLSEVRARLLLVSNQFQRGAVTIRATNQAGALIRLGNIPDFRQDNLIAFVWLVFCSGPLLASSTSNLVPAFFHDYPPQAGTSFFVPGSWDLIPVSPRLPLQVLFQDDGSIYSASEVEVPPRSYTLTRASSKLADQRAKYEVTGVKDFDGMRLPSVFRCVRYTQLLDATGSAHPVPLYTIEGETLHASAQVSRTALAILTPRVTAVKDLRFSDEIRTPAIGYITAPGPLPSKAEVREKADFQRAQSMASQSAKQERHLAHTRVTMVAAIGMGTLIFATMLWRSRNRH
jgi:hypothetical protein